MTLRITNSIRDWNVHQVERNAFLCTQKQQWGEADFNACEYLEEDQVTLPYFDRDEYRTEQPTQQQLLEAQQQFVTHVQDIFNTDVKFGSHSLVVATRHGYVPDGRFKISFRAVVHGYSIRMGSIPALIHSVAKVPDYFDTSPYHSRQKLAVLGACKGSGDTRVLQPVQADVERVQDFLVQLLQGEEQMLEVPDLPVYSKAKSIGEAQAGAVWSKAAPCLESAGFLAPRPIGTREHSVTFTCDNRSSTHPCPLCACVHDRCVCLIKSKGKQNVAFKSFWSAGTTGTLLRKWMVLIVSRITANGA